MAKARNPLFALEARGKISGLTLSRRRSVAQVFRSLKASTEPPSQSQRGHRHIFRQSVPLWRAHYLAPRDTFAWDRLRRYNRLPGTAFTRWLTDYLPMRYAGITTFNITNVSVLRSPSPQPIAIGAHLDAPPSQVWCSFGPTPDYPATIAQMTELIPGFWLATPQDRWRGQRVYARVSACIFGPTVAGLSGLYASTSYG